VKDIKGTIIIQCMRNLSISTYVKEKVPVGRCNKLWKIFTSRSCNNEV